MLVKERSTRKLLTLFGRELRLHRYWTMDEDIMTGKVTNRKLHEFRFDIRKEEKYEPITTISS